MVGYFHRLKNYLCEHNDLIEQIGSAQPGHNSLVVPQENVCENSLMKRNTTWVVFKYNNISTYSTYSSKGE